MYRCMARHVHVGAAKLEGWRKKGNPNPEKQNHKHKEYGKGALGMPSALRELQMHKHNMKQHIKIPPNSQTS